MIVDDVKAPASARPRPSVVSAGRRSLRVLLVIDSLEVGGAERHLVDLAAGLRPIGTQVAVVCACDGPLRAGLDAGDVPVWPVLDRSVKRQMSLRFAHEVRTIMRSNPFDVVHAHLYAGTAAAAVATLRLGVPLVVTEHSDAAWRPRHARFASRWMYSRAAHILAVSDAIERRLVEQDDVSPQRITVVPNAVPHVSMPDPDALGGFRRGGPLIGVVARLQPEKGVSLFLEMASSLASSIPECRFVVIGDGPEHGALLDQAMRLRLDDRVSFLGCRADARALVAGLDVLVLPSTSEGSPLVTLEAMAAAVPVVACAVGGVPDQIRHGREGLLVRAGDARALAEACKVLVQDPVYARRLGEAGRRRVSTHFDHAEMVQRVQEVYERVAQPFPAALR